MTLADYLSALKERDGGFTVRIEPLGADGAATDRGHEIVAADALVSEHAFAYVHAGGGRPHGVLVEHVLWEGDAEDDVVIIPIDRHHRLTLGVVWTEEHRRVLQGRRAVAHGPTEPGLREFLGELGREVSVPPRRPVASHEFKASWRARVGDGGTLRTVGALLLGARGELRYADVRPGASDPQLAAALGNGPPAEVFEYLVHSGNGISNDWSVPFVVSGPSIEFTAARLVTRVRFTDRPAAHLRELWLSAWPDTVRYIAEEAELAAAGAALNESGVGYLARIRAALGQTQLGH